MLIIFKGNLGLFWLQCRVGAGGLRLQSHWSGLKATQAHLMCLQSNNHAAFEVWGVQRIEQAHGAASKNRLHPASVILQCTAQVSAQVTNINPTLIFQDFRQCRWKSWAGLFSLPLSRLDLTVLLQCRSGLLPVPLEAARCSRRKWTWLPGLWGNALPVVTAVLWQSQLSHSW